MPATQTKKKAKFLVIAGTGRRGAESMVSEHSTHEDAVQHTVNLAAMRKRDENGETERQRYPTIKLYKVVPIE